MARETYYPSLFRVASLYNIGVSVIFSIAYLTIFHFLGLRPPLYPALLHLFMVLVFVFGLGFYWVSQDIYSNHGIVKMAVIAKILVFVVLLLHAFLGRLDAALVVPGLADFVFAVLFIEFLFNYHRVPRKS